MIYTVPIAEDIMTPNPITVPMDMDASEAADIMVRERIGVLPVTDPIGRVRGVLTKIEVLEAVAKS